MSCKRWSSGTPYRRHSRVIIATTGPHTVSRAIDRLKIWRLNLPHRKCFVIGPVDHFGRALRGRMVKEADEVANPILDDGRRWRASAARMSAVNEVAKPPTRHAFTELSGALFRNSGPRAGQPKSRRSWPISSRCCAAGFNPRGSQPAGALNDRC